MKNKPQLDRERYNRHLCNLSHAICPRNLQRSLRLTTFAALKILLEEMPDDYWQHYGDLERRTNHPRYQASAQVFDEKSPLEAYQDLKRTQILTECGFAAAINTSADPTWSADDCAHYRRYQCLVIVSCLQLYLIGDHGSAIENALREIRLIATDAKHTPVLQELPKMATHLELESLIDVLHDNRHHPLEPLIERGFGFLCVVIYDAYRLAKGVTRYRKSKKLPTAEHHVELIQLEKTDDTDLVVEELLLHADLNEGQTEEDESAFAYQPRTLRVDDPSSPHQSQFLRAEQNKRFTEQLAQRQLSLPCSFEQASDWDIEHLVRDTVDTLDQTGLWLLLSLVCGGIPPTNVTTGRRVEVMKDWPCLIIEHEVPARKLEERLHSLLPPAMPRFVLPLPAALRNLDFSAPCPDEDSLKNFVKSLNNRRQTRLTLGRITRYLEHWYVNQGIDMVQVALVRGLDHQKRPALAYSNIPADQITEHHRTYQKYLFSLAERDAVLPKAISVPRTVGSSLHLPDKVLHNLFNLVLSPPPLPRRDAGLDVLVDFHNRFLCYVWALLTFVTGHRDVTAPMGSLADYNPVMRTWWISDKEIRNGPAARILLIPPTAARQVELYQDHLRALSQRFRLQCREMALRCDATLDGSKNLLFFIHYDHAGHLKPRDVTPRDLKQHLADRLPLQHNWARHHLRSVLLRSELAPSVIDGWMGHEDVGEAMFGRHSGLSVQALQQVAELIEAHLNNHQIEARAGWQTL